MLHLDQRQIGFGSHVPAALGREVIRMPVNGDDLRRVLEQVAVEGQVVSHVVSGRRVLQVAHVLAEDRLAILDQAEAVLEFAAERQHLRLAIEAFR